MVTPSRKSIERELDLARKYPYRKRVRLIVSINGASCRYGDIRSCFRAAAPAGNYAIVGKRGKSLLVIAAAAKAGGRSVSGKHIYMVNREDVATFGDRVTRPRRKRR